MLESRSLGAVAPTLGSPFRAHRSDQKRPSLSFSLWTSVMGLFKLFSSFSSLSLGIGILLSSHLILHWQFALSSKSCHWQHYCLHSAVFDHFQLQLAKLLLCTGNSVVLSSWGWSRCCRETDLVKLYLWVIFPEAVGIDAWSWHVLIL